VKCNERARPSAAPSKNDGTFACPHAQGDVTEPRSAPYSLPEAKRTSRITEQKVRPLSPSRSMKGVVMMESVLNCGTGGWFMIAAGIATYGVLALAGAALVKYLF